MNTFAFVPGKHLDVITFEVKPADAIDVTAVYEALSHRRAATHAYVVLHTPVDESPRTDLERILDEICLEAKRHKIGVITVTEPDDYEHWETLVEAERLEPDPSKLNDFIATQLSDYVKEKLQRWYR